MIITAELVAQAGQMGLVTQREIGDGLVGVRELDGDRLLTVTVTVIRWPTSDANRPPALRPAALSIVTGRAVGCPGHRVRPPGAGGLAGGELVAERPRRRGAERTATEHGRVRRDLPGLGRDPRTPAHPSRPVRRTLDRAAAGGPGHPATGSRGADRGVEIGVRRRLRDVPVEPAAARGRRRGRRSAGPHGTGSTAT